MSEIESLKTASLNLVNWLDDTSDARERFGIGQLRKAFERLSSPEVVLSLISQLDAANRELAACRSAGASATVEEVMELADSHAETCVRLGYSSDAAETSVDKLRAAVTALVAKAKRADAVVTAAREFRDAKTYSPSGQALIAAVDAYDKGETT